MTASVVRVRVTPRAGRSEVSRVEDGVVHVRVAAPPVEGAANRAVTELLAGALGLRRSAVAIRSGAGSREKTFTVEGMDAAEVLERLARASGRRRGG